MKILLVDAQLRRFSRVRDGAVDLYFRTLNEVTATGFSLVDNYYQQNGKLAFKLGDIQLTDIPDDTTLIKGQRSPSQQLRLKIFALHMKQGGTKDDSGETYEKWMNKFSQEVQDELDQLGD